MSTLQQSLERQINRLEAKDHNSLLLRDLNNQLTSSDPRSTEDLSYAVPLFSRSSKKG